MRNEQQEICVPEPRQGKQGSGKAFGTFGELLQGCLEAECRYPNFLVTLPIACYSQATFVSTPETTCITVTPAYKHKSQQLVGAMLRHFNLPPGGELTLVSDLPIGKGLASSSADLVASARSIASCFDIRIPVTLLERFMAAIEPSDGVMYSGIVSFYHQQVRLREFLGFLPPLTILGIDEGGEVDTCQFNMLPKRFTVRERHEYLNLLNSISNAVRKQDLATVGQITTRSALLNQKLNPKQTLKELLTICSEVGGLGVVVAHSGTCLGILLSEGSASYARQVRLAYRFLSGLSKNVLVYRSIDFSCTRG